MNFARRLALLLLPLGAVLAASPASAVAVSPTSTFYFSGLCTDCQGVGNGELVLSNYTLGQTITRNNFVSFHYDGSNLVPGGFTITDTTYGIGGSINAPLPGTESFRVYGSTNYFVSGTDGSWQLGLSRDVTADYGTAGTYNATPTATVPEPLSLSLLAAGLAGTALVRRRRA